METTPLLFGFIAGFTLFAIVSMTAFIKISVVLMIVRQALGLQQVPSNVVILGLTFFLAAYISKPVFVQSIADMSDLGGNVQSAEDVLALAAAGFAPFRDFVTANIDLVHLDFLVEMTSDVWASSGVQATEDDVMVLIPAFMITELTEAFEIGFLLYLPFVAIDLAVTGILMALGMQMVQPNIITVPFKLLTFVYVDGWARLSEGLIMTYGG